MKKNIDKLSLGVSILPLTLFIIRRLKIGMIAPWTYIIFVVYALIIVAGFVFAIYLMKNKNTRTPTAKAALILSSLYVAFFIFFIYLTIAANI